MGKVAPAGMATDAVPQIVMFTFDDAVNEQVFDYYQQLFPRQRVNPNGCPVSATFFVSHNWTDYNMVKQLYLRGHEIASHSITHRMPQSWWTHASYETLRGELAGQRNNIIHKASIPRAEVRGVRIPFLAIAGDRQFSMMRDEGFEYDASFMTGPFDDGGLWPYTLDFPPAVPAHCSNDDCPKESYPGMWEVPLNRWIGTDGGACAMVDSCQTQPSHKGEALSYLWQNFNKHYYGNKAPVGVNMHAVWFKTEYHFAAMKEFVETLAEMDDVYIVTVHQTLQWMKEPRTLEQVHEWPVWMNACQGRSRKKLVKMVPKTKQAPSTSTPMPTMTEDDKLPSIRPKKQPKKGGKSDDDDGRPNEGGPSERGRGVRKNKAENAVQKPGGPEKGGREKTRANGKTNGDEKRGQKPGRGRPRGQGGRADLQSRGGNKASAATAVSRGNSMFSVIVTVVIVTVLSDRKQQV